MMMSDDAV